MNYYEVAPGDKNYMGRTMLTYCYPEELTIGQIVVVNVRTKSVLGVVIKLVDKPAFEAKLIKNVHKSLVIPNSQILLFEWLMKYYPSSTGSMISLFLPKALLKTKVAKKIDVISTVRKVPQINLTADQQKTLSKIDKSKSRVHIVHGNTGTGKTQVYIELAKQTVAKGQSVIILTPEISLTPQLLEQFNRYFDNVSLFHSSLSEADKRDLWFSLITTPTTPRVVLGPRSALLRPLDNVGLIVIDEFHDSSFKQEQNPRYNAVQTAAMLSSIAKCKLILGSATPPVEEYFYATSRGAVVHRMLEKPLSSNATVSLKVVDLADKNIRSNSPLITTELINSIRKNLEKNRQIMVFLNRRGTSRLVVCKNCGWSIDCSRCNIPYTYHHDAHILMCHVCSSKTNMPTTCPECGSTDLLLKKPGTKGIFENLSKIFPDAKIGRYDKDNKIAETFFSNQQSISAGDVNILIGTQLLTKGHDLPNLGLVIVLLAEEGLNFPDYKSHEKSFILMHQLAGRVARRDFDGEIIVQTYSPTSTIVDYLNNEEGAWVNFYNNELEQRQKYGYPPFSFILKVQIHRKTEKSAEKVAQNIEVFVREKFGNTVALLGPSPAFSNMQNGEFIWQLVIKSKKRSVLLKVIDQLPSNCIYNIDPDDLL